MSHSSLAFVFDLHERDRLLDPPVVESRPPKQLSKGADDLDSASLLKTQREPSMNGYPTSEAVLHWIHGPNLARVIHDSSRRNPSPQAMLQELYFDGGW